MSVQTTPRSAAGLTDRQRDEVIELAVDSIERGVHHGQPLSVGEERLDGYLGELRATFVTVYVDDQLDGCIGSLQARRELGRDVAHNAFMAAFRDPRFDPLTAAKLDLLDVEISVLGPLRRVEVDNEAHLVELIEPGVHGLVLECGARRGTLLPSVWEKCPDPARFVGHVKQKAGLPVDFWSAQMRASVYEVEVFGSRR